MRKLLFQGGTLVLPAGPQQADLLVEGETIAQIGQHLSADGCETVDATGCLLFPGFIDAHTHLDMSNGVTTTADDWASGTAGAVAGGTTTLIDFATQDKGGTLAQALTAWHKNADGKAHCDYGFHMAICDWNEHTRAEIKEMAAQGVTSFKIYFAYDNLRVSDATAFEILQAVRQVGGLVGCHCENGDLVNERIAQFRAQGKLGTQYHPLARPAEIEAEAVNRWAVIGKMAGAPVMVVHLSTAQGVEQVRIARARGAEVYAESCPQYLTMDASVYNLPDFEGAKYVCSPPLRSQADEAALWGAVKTGEIDTISTDHCSFNFKGQKELGRADFSKIPNGMPGLQHRPILMYTAGVATGRISALQMATLLAQNPARLYGLYPRKGVLAVGSDADLVLWNPSQRGVIRATDQLQNVDYTPFEGMETVGFPQQVYLRGRLAAQNGRLAEGAQGQYVARGVSELYRAK